MQLHTTLKLEFTIFDAQLIGEVMVFRSFDGVGAYHKDSGEIIWFKEFTDDLGFGLRKLAVVGDKLITSVHTDKNKAEVMLKCFDIATGTELWSQKAGWHLNHYSGGMHAEQDGTFITIEQGAEGQELATRRSTRDGNVIHQQVLNLPPNFIIKNAQPTTGGIFYTGTALCFLDTKSFTWSEVSNLKTSTIDAFGEYVYAVGQTFGSKPQLMQIDISSKKISWSADLDAAKLTDNMLVSAGESCIVVKLGYQQPTVIFDHSGTQTGILPETSGNALVVANKIIFIGTNDQKKSIKSCNMLGTDIEEFEINQPINTMRMIKAGNFVIADNVGGDQVVIRV